MRFWLLSQGAVPSAPEAVKRAHLLQRRWGSSSRCQAYWHFDYRISIEHENANENEAANVDGRSQKFGCRWWRLIRGSGTLSAHFPTTLFVLHTWYHISGYWEIFYVISKACTGESSMQKLPELTVWWVVNTVADFACLCRLLSFPILFALCRMEQFKMWALKMIAHTTRGLLSRTDAVGISFSLRGVLKIRACRSLDVTVVHSLWHSLLTMTSDCIVHRKTNLHEVLFDRYVRVPYTAYAKLHCANT